MKTDMLPRVTPQFVALGTFFFADDESEMHMPLINSYAKRECTTGGSRDLQQTLQMSNDERCSRRMQITATPTLVLGINSRSVRCQLSGLSDKQ